MSTCGISQLSGNRNASGKRVVNPRAPRGTSSAARLGSLFRNERCRSTRFPAPRIRAIGANWTVRTAAAAAVRSAMRFHAGGARPPPSAPLAGRRGAPSGHPRLAPGPGCRFRARRRGRAAAVAPHPRANARAERGCRGTRAARPRAGGSRGAAGQRSISKPGSDGERTAPRARTLVASWAGQQRAEGREIMGIRKGRAEIAGDSISGKARHRGR